MRHKNNRVLITGVIIIILATLIFAQSNAQAITFKELGPFETYPSHNVFFSFTVRTHSVWGNRDNVFVALMITPKSPLTNITVNVENVTFIVSTYKDFTRNTSRSYYYFQIYRSNFTSPINVPHNVSFTFNVPREATSDMMLGVRIFFNYTYNAENITGISEVKDVGFVKYKEYFFNILGFDFLTIVLGALLLAYPISYIYIKKNPRVKAFLLLFLIVITGLVILPVSNAYFSQVLKTPVQYKNSQFTITDSTVNITIAIDIRAPERVVYPNEIPIFVRMNIIKGTSEFNITGISMSFVGLFYSNGTQIPKQDTNRISTFVIESTNTSKMGVIEVQTINRISIIPQNIKIVGFAKNDSIYERSFSISNGLTIDIIHWWNEQSQYARVYSVIVYISLIMIGDIFVIIHWLKGKKAKEEYYI